MNDEAGRHSLENLLEGNARFVSGRDEHPRRGASRRAETAAGQRPVAAVVACSDSRVPPEIIFDQGIGDLFVVRVAGNLVDDLGLASVEYAVEQLRVPLVLVLGHSRCGAVKAALGDAPSRRHLGRFAEALRPAVERARSARNPADADAGDAAAIADDAARENVKSVVSSLRSSGPVIAPRAASGELAVVGAFYDIESGAVELIETIRMPRTP